MKNNIKNLIVSFFSLVLLFIGQNAFAVNPSYVSWNTASNDCPDINIANVDTEEGFGDPCWTGTNITANPGETVNIRVYYHNTGNQTATDTYIRVVHSPSSGSATTHTFTGQIFSDQNDLYSSPVTVTLPSSQTLTFGSTEWYPNQTTTPPGSDFLGNQDGSEVLDSSGLYIGDITPGWGSQGSVVVSFIVGTTPPPSCSITSFTANPETITVGQSSDLTWTTSNCATTKLYKGNALIGTYNPNDSQIVWPTVTTTYTLKAYTSNGTLGDTENKTVTVTTPPPSCLITSLTANPQTIQQGGSSILSWSTSNCSTTKLFIGSTLIGTYGPSASQTVWPTVTTTYTLKAYTSNGTLGDTETTTVTVTNPQSCSITSFTANPQTIQQGGSSILSWTTSNCATTRLSIGMKSLGVFGSSGSQSVSPTITTTYTLKAYTSNGTLGDTENKTVTVTTPPPSCLITSLTANPTHINNDESSTLSWTTSNCLYTKLFNGNTQIGPAYYGSSINVSVSPNSTTTYTVKAYNNNGTVGDTENVVVYVNTADEMTGNIDALSPSCIISSGNSTCPIPFTWSTENPIGVSAVTNNGNTVATGNNGNQSFNVSFGSQTYYLYNSGVELDSATVSTSCAYGSSWNGSYCSTTIIPPDECQITSFTANPSTIPSGESSLLSWATNNCDTTKLFVGSTQIGVYGSSDSQIVWPEHTTTYTLKAYNSNGVLKDTEQVTVSISNQTCSISFFYAVPQVITSGESSVLHWNTNGCDTTKLFVGYTQIGTYGPSEAITVWPEHTTTYTLKAYNQNGTLGDTESVTIEVNALPNCSINNFTASPISITEGGSSILSWTTTNCVNVSISGIGDNLPLSGSQTVWPTETTTYTLTATGQNGNIQTRTATVYVNNNNNSNCYIYSFYAIPSSIEEGESSRLYWTTNNCTYVEIEGIGEVQSSGSRTVWPNYTRTYILNAEDGNGNSTSAEATVYVDEENSNSCEIIDFDATDTSIEEGDETTLEWETEDCDRVNISHIGNVPDSGDEDVSPNRDTTYVLTAYDFDGSRQTESVRIYVDEYDDNDDECRIDSFTASDTYIDRGDEVNLRWRTTDCDDVSITNLGDVSDDGDEDIYPYQSTTYTLRAYGDGGSDSKSIRINVNNYYNDDLYNTNVITTVATNISQTGAQLNGLLTGQSYSGGSIYFEYGRNIDLGMRTASRMATSNNTFSEYVTNLNPGTIYYFRAVAEGQYGLSYGAIEVFQTPRSQVSNYNYDNIQTIREVRQVVVQGPTVFGSDSPIMLEIENRYQMIGVGDVIDYVIFYKNISNSKLTDPMVQVFFPEGIEFVNSSRGTYSEGDKTLSVPIEDLDPNDEGTIYAQAVVRSLERNIAQIVTTAVLIYTNPSGAQANAMAYVLNNPGKGSALGASAFFGNIFGMNLIGWLLLIIIILLLVLVVRSYYGRQNLLVSPFHSDKNHL